MADPSGFIMTHAVEVWDGYNDEYTTLITTTKKVGMGTGLAASGILIAGGIVVAAAIVTGSEVPISYGVVSSTVGAGSTLETVKKIVRNPYGRNGCPAHQEVISKAESLLQEYGCTVQREFFVKIQNGYKSCRFGDLFVIEPNGEQWILQVGKQTLGGKPVSREVKAMVDLIKAGYDVVFLPYN